MFLEGTFMAFRIKEPASSTKFNVQVAFACVFAKRIEIDFANVEIKFGYIGNSFLPRNGYILMSLLLNSISRTQRLK
jgi:hypothetical protein